MLVLTASAASDVTILFQFHTFGCLGGELFTALPLYVFGGEKWVDRSLFSTEKSVLIPARLHKCPPDDGVDVHC
jgi:hypothetical protein